VQSIAGCTQRPLIGINAANIGIGPGAHEVAKFIAGGLKIGKPWDCFSFLEQADAVLQRTMEQICHTEPS
jgi:hypothetical protein